ncbi:transposase [Cohaesibacter sp. ES.047]|uniref:helix-turn-helix domain-containing protein n=1 Tax=Cohaesibacter sp. ES.047 TaxID=1798205 RepID=UPI000BB8FE12|nr:transposase [Cohaesibacter sp. ES.047]
MGKSLPIALRERVASFVDAGHSHRAAASHFRVSPRFVNNLMLLKKETGSVQPRKQGRPDKGKLGVHHEWITRRMSENGDLTLDELCLELAERGVHVHRSSVGRLLNRLGLSHKKKSGSH